MRKLGLKGAELAGAERGSKTMAVARRVLGVSDSLTLQIGANYAKALYEDDSATLDDLNEAVTTLEDTLQIARRVFGVSHPLTAGIKRRLRDARVALRARETPRPGNA